LHACLRDLAHVVALRCITFNAGLLEMARVADSLNIVLCVTTQMADPV
jgi:hypothetical protein